MKKRSLKVPKSMQQKYDDIVALTDKFSDEKLNDEYKELARALTAKLCRKKNSPITSATIRSWACGVIHALGMVNFLYDNSAQPYCSNADLISWFNVGQSTASSRSKQIRDMLDMSQLDYEWILPGRMEDFSAVWYIKCNGLIVDVRDMPLEVQEIAFEQGLIPYIPGLRDGDQEDE